MDFQETSILIIGDPHFRARHIPEGNDLVSKCVETASIIRPTMIVLLGDVLDTHEVARNQPYKLACDFIEQLSVVAPTYVLMGNHDLINASQFLTDNHFFGPLKKWDRVTIVDTPTVVETEDGHTFVMCPYVPPGRFIEALDTLEDTDWTTATCIFAHQEFRGVVIGDKQSDVGDEWDESYPPVISGHIHKAQDIKPNIYYPGSSIQVNFDEDPDKKIWNVTFDDEGIQIDRMSLGLKGKKEVTMSIDAVSDFDFAVCDDYYVKLRLTGTPESFKVFRKNPLYNRLNRAGVRVVFDRVSTRSVTSVAVSAQSREATSFEGVLREVVKTKSDAVQSAYQKLYGTEDIVYELVFVEEPN